MRQFPYGAIDRTYNLTGGVTQDSFTFTGITGHVLAVVVLADITFTNADAVNPHNLTRRDMLRCFDLSLQDAAGKYRFNNLLGEHIEYMQALAGYDGAGNEDLYAITAIPAATAIQRRFSFVIPYANRFQGTWYTDGVLEAKKALQTLTIRAIPETGDNPALQCTQVHLRFQVIYTEDMPKHIGVRDEIIVGNYQNEDDVDPGSADYTVAALVRIAQYQSGTLPVMTAFGNLEMREAGITKVTSFPVLDSQHSTNALILGKSTDGFDDSDPFLRHTTTGGVSACAALILPGTMPRNNSSGADCLRGQINLKWTGTAVQTIMKRRIYANTTTELASRYTELSSDMIQALLEPVAGNPRTRAFTPDKVATAAVQGSISDTIKVAAMKRLNK